MHKSRTGNFTGTEASRTDVDVSGRAVHDCLDALDVGLPGAIGTAMGMGYLDTEHYALVAKVALSHFAYLLIKKLRSFVKNSFLIIADDLRKIKRKREKN